MAAIVSSCATSRTLDEQILTANRTVTFVVASTDAALKDGAITAQQAQAVSAIAHQVDPLLDSVRSASRATDPATANKTMVLVNKLLAALATYVPPSASTSASK